MVCWWPGILQVLAGFAGFMCHVVPFGMAATKITNVLDDAYDWHLVSDVPSVIVVDGEVLPGVDPYIRIWTTVQDTMDILFLAIFSAYHWAAVTQKRYPLVSEGATTQRMFDVPQADGYQGVGQGSYAKADKWYYYFLSGFFTMVRMGDAFAAHAVASYCTPLAMFASSRIAALAIGSIPGIPSGTPSLTTQLLTGYIFARHRVQLKAKLLQFQNAPGSLSWSTSFVEDWFCYAFCCCFIVAEDTLAVDSVAGVALKPLMRLEQVGEPVRTTQLLPD